MTAVDFEITVIFLEDCLRTFPISCRRFGKSPCSDHVWSPENSNERQSLQRLVRLLFKFSMAALYLSNVYLVSESTVSGGEGATTVLVMLLVVFGLRTKRQAPATLAITVVMAEIWLRDVSTEEVSKPIGFRFTRSLDFFESFEIVGSISYEDPRRHTGGDGWIMGDLAQ